MELILNEPSADTGHTGPGTHLLQQNPQSDPGLAQVVDAIAETTKAISDRLRCFGLNQLRGTVGRANVHGEAVTCMDDYAHRAIVTACRACPFVAMIVSEEAEKAMAFPGMRDRRSYEVFVDPLDGSSNVDVCVPVATIFSIYESPRGATGRSQVAAGYALYGSSTQLVYTAGEGVHAFTLDPQTGGYRIYASDIRMPNFGGIYSVNQAYANRFPPAYRAYLDRLAEGLDGRPFSLRYVGSLVSDFHRTLWKGGVFLYPGEKLRLAYEANPLAWIAEAAGGVATDGARPILDVESTGIHQRTPFLFGSVEEMTALEAMIGRYR